MPDGIRGIDEVQKRSPFTVMDVAELEAHMGSPTRTARFLDQAHPRLVRGSSPFLAVAVQAGADHVFPGRGPPPRTRNHVVDVELLSRQGPLAVLAGVPVPKKDIHPGETDVTLGDTVVGH